MNTDNNNENRSEAFNSETPADIFISGEIQGQESMPENIEDTSALFVQEETEAAQADMQQGIDIGPIGSNGYPAIQPKPKKKALKWVMLSLAAVIILTVGAFLIYVNSENGKIASAEKLCLNGDYAGTVEKLAGTDSEKASALKKYAELRLKVNDLINGLSTYNSDDGLNQLKPLIVEVATVSSLLSETMQKDTAAISAAYDAIQADFSKLEPFKSNILRACGVYDKMKFLYSQNHFTVAKQRVAAVEYRAAYDEAVKIYNEVMQTTDGTFYGSKSLLSTIEALDSQLNYAIEEGWGENTTIYIMDNDPDRFGDSPYNDSQFSTLFITMKRQIITNHFKTFTPTETK